MSVLAVTPEGDGVPVTDARTLAFMRECGVTVALEEGQIRRLQLAMSRAVLAGESAVADLREIVGPEAAGIAQQLVRLMLMGTGYFRAANDTVNALFHARAKGRRATKKGGQC